MTEQTQIVEHALAEPPAQRSPFWWLRWTQEESANGMELGLVVYSMLTATRNFSVFLDNVEHTLDDHFEAFCFKCFLKEVQLASSKARTEEQFLQYLAKTMPHWCAEVDDDFLFSRIHDSLELWSSEFDKIGYVEQLLNLFKFDMRKKHGCYECPHHYSEDGAEYLINAEGQPVQQFLLDKITEVPRRCFHCGSENAYKRVSLGKLPQCLVFANTSAPPMILKYDEIVYNLKVVIPKLSECKVFVFEAKGIIEIDFKRILKEYKPVNCLDGCGLLDYAFYAKV